MHSRITDKLRDAFAPLHLEVIDESHKHHGHSGWREGGSTHFRITIIAPVFAGHSQVACHRMIYIALKEELNSGVHALSITASAA